MNELGPAQVGALLRPGMKVAVFGGCNEPRGIAAALHAQPEATAGVEFTVTRIPGISSPTLAPWSGSTVRSFFVTPEMRAGFEAGSVRFVPMQYRHIWDHLLAEPFDLAIAQFTPPDRNGDCSLGLGAGFLPALLGRPEISFVAEWNRALPRLPAAPTVRADRFDYVVETEIEPPTLASRPGAVTERIGALVAELVRDGDCIETGVGAIPGAVLAALRGHRDLGFHSGLLSDGVMDLVEAGVLNGARKSIDRGRLVAAMVLGSPALYDWASRSDLIELRGTNYTHDVRVIAELDNFVALNSAVEVRTCSARSTRRWFAAVRSAARAARSTSCGAPGCRPAGGRSSPSRRRPAEAASPVSSRRCLPSTPPQRSAPTPTCSSPSTASPRSAAWTSWNGLED